MKKCKACGELKPLTDFNKSGAFYYRSNCKLCSALSTLQNVWGSMRYRCSNASHPKYVRYGGRCIVVCAEWSTFKAFEIWALANGYAKGLTLDRRDNDGNYEPSNCRWVTMKVQQNNKSNHILVTFNGTTKNLCQWCEELNISYSVVKNRLKDGWTFEKAISVPIRKLVRIGD